MYQVRNEFIRKQLRKELTIEGFGLVQVSQQTADVQSQTLNSGWNTKLCAYFIILGIVKLLYACETFINGTDNDE